MISESASKPFFGRTRRILRGALPLCLLASLALGASAQEPQEESTASQARAPLPSPACLKILREARILGYRGETDTELRKLLEAREAFPDEFVVSSALLGYHHRLPLPPETLQGLLAEIESRLKDEQNPISIGVLRQVIEDPETGESLLLALAEHLAGREERDSSPEVLRSLIRVYDRLEDSEAALAASERLWKIAPSEELRYHLVGRNTVLDRWERVLELLEEQVQKKGPLLLKTKLLAMSHVGDPQALLPLMEGQFEGIVQDRALGIEDGFEFIRRIAWNLRDRGADAEAETLFRRLQEIYPDSEEIRTVLLHLYSTPEEAAAQKAALEQSWSQEQDPQALLDEGTARLTNGDFEGAFELLQRAAPEFPALEAAWYNLGMVSYRLEKWQPAEEAFARAYGLNPARADSFFFRGIALQQLSRCSDAVQDLEKALALDPQRTDTHYYLATCYKALGNGDAASRHQAAYKAAREGA